jgi:hypothetical protein
MPESTGRHKSRQWQCLVLRVVPVGGSVVPVLIGGTGESPVVPVGQIHAELFFVVNCTSGSTGGWTGSTGLDRW